MGWPGDPQLKPAEGWSRLQELLRLRRCHVRTRPG